jgi:hypothetical protein
MMAFNNSNTPSNAIPSIRNGMLISQKIGYSTNASRAIGQQRIKRRIQIKKLNII